MKTYKMSRSTAILITFLMMIGLAILASSCGTKPQTIAAKSPVDTLTTDYPYTWDTVKYNRIISYINGEATSLDYDLSVMFNEEFIEITDNDTDIKTIVIFVGHWSNKYTFIIDNNYGVCTVNLKTGYMTIRYQDNKKEIYTH